MGKFEEKHNTVVRSALSFKGSRVSVVTLVTFTGDRFLRSATADCTNGLEVPEAEAEAAQAVVAMMEGNAPAEMHVAKLQQVLQTCRFFMADPLVHGFAGYLDGVASQLPDAEVRTRHAVVDIAAIEHVFLHTRRDIATGLTLSSTIERVCSTRWQCSVLEHVYGKPLQLEFLL